MTAEASERGWWRRLRANTKDESPFPEGFLEQLAVEIPAVRKRNLRERRLARRAALKSQAVES